jgi:hypothetical protein
MGEEDFLGHRQRTAKLLAQNFVPGFELCVKFADGIELI